MTERKDENTRFPEGTVQALSSASATIFPISLGFFGIWAFQGGMASNPWNLKHLVVILPVIFALYNLGTVTLAATRPLGEAGREYDGFVLARKKFLLGVLSLILAVTIAAGMDFSRQF